MSEAAHLEVDAVKVSFGGVQALDGVSFDVQPGSVVGLIGANGSGKTTLLDVVSGLVTPDSGTVHLDGEDMQDHLPEERAQLGLVRSFQDCRLFPELTVHDALMLTLDARRPVGIVSTTIRLPSARRAEAEKRSAVAGVIDAFRLDRFRTHRIRQLSTGTRRVVDLASIVLAGPGIAQREAEAFIPLLGRLHDVTGATILLVEHDVLLVFAVCTQVVVMASGSIVSAGAPDAVRSDPRALAAYLGASDEALLVSGPHRPDVAP